MSLSTLRELVMDRKPGALQYTGWVTELEGLSNWVTELNWNIYPLTPGDGLRSLAWCPSPTLRCCSNSCPPSWWCHPTISFSAVPFPSCLQSSPASGSFPMSQFFASGGQSIRASLSVLPMDTQDLFLLGLTSWISLLSKGLSRVFSNTTVQQHQFFCAQLSF